MARAGRGAGAGVGAGLYTFDVTHRFSDKARGELRARQGAAFQDWPRHNTREFHAMLFRRDLGRLSSKAKTTPLMASAPGNITSYNQRDGLQYTYIEIGTPSRRFFVALDTGSDLLWLPCAGCVSCASAVSAIYETTFSVYDASNSSSYAGVTCASPYCVDLTSSCASSDTPCPYNVQYLSPASTQGYLVEDVIYLVPQSGGNKTAAGVVFGLATRFRMAF